MILESYCSPHRFRSFPTWKVLPCSSNNHHLGEVSVSYCMINRKRLLKLLLNLLFLETEQLEKCITKLSLICKSAFALNLSVTRAALQESFLKFLYEICSEGRNIQLANCCCKAHAWHKHLIIIYSFQSDDQQTRQSKWKFRFLLYTQLFSVEKKASKQQHIERSFSFPVPLPLAGTELRNISTQKIWAHII